MSNAATMNFAITDLFSTATSRMLTMPADMNGVTARVVTMTPNCIMTDLIQCLENGKSKYAKRIARAEFIARTYKHALKEETLSRLERAVVIAKEAMKTEQDDNAENVDELIAESKIMRQANGEITFNKPDVYGVFKQPKKQALHDACKKVVNDDGVVYDVFSAIAVISFNELLRQTNMSSIREMLISRSKLVMKGGAAVGKFLYKAIPSVWMKLTKEDKEFVESAFIRGGDNDTSISFDKVSDLYDVDAINNEIGSIVYDLQAIVMKNVKVFNVDAIIGNYMKEVTSLKVKYDDAEVTFTGRAASSFAIVDKNKLQNEVVMTNSNGSQIFGSISYLQFAAADGVTKFHLARVKAAFKATVHTDIQTSINCYSELLDITAACVDTVKLLDYEFQAVRRIRFA